MSTRSNQAAVDQMNRLLGKLGYCAESVELGDCLHLKSALTRLDAKTVLINRNWVDSQPFARFDLIDVDTSEPWAANCLPINGTIIFPAAFPKTRAKLETRGYEVKTVQVDELAKAEGAVTCCSLIID